MTLDARRLARTLAERGAVARVVVAGTRGSVPREAGAEMLVWADGQSGTIGGGALEWEALRRARAMLAGALGPGSPAAMPCGAASEGRAAEDRAQPAGPGADAAPASGWGARGDGSPPTRPTPRPGRAPPGRGASPRSSSGAGTCATAPAESEAVRQDGRAAPRLTRHPLGPELGQCCGGAVSLVTEVLRVVPSGPVRGLRLEGSSPAPVGGAPTAVRPTRIEAGWLVEPVVEAREPLWIWGAGHVGRALVATLGPLDAHDIAWIDVARERFPDDAAGPVVAADPARLAARAPRDARHLIVTHSHGLDLALCDALLRRGFVSCGLIGSATKWARFRSRLRAMGHAGPTLARIECPIGDPSLGKHPQAVAIGVAAAILRPSHALRASA